MASSQPQLHLQTESEDVSTRQLTLALEKIRAAYGTDLAAFFKAEQKKPNRPESDDPQLWESVLRVVKP